ncbi:MAG: CDP-alcohol phosphatidyltransferase family protein [Deltaproteobacteria bacterium]
MDHAIVVAAGTGIDNEKLAPCGKLVFGGIPQLKRLLITAQRAGINRFTIITEQNDSSLQGIIRGDGRITSDIIWRSLGAPADFDNTAPPSLVVQSNLVITPAGLSGLMKSEPAEGEVLLLVEPRREATAAISGEAVRDISLEGARAIGAFIASGALLEKSIANSMSLQGWMRELAGSDRVKCAPISGGYWMHLTSAPDSAEKAEEMLFSNVTKSTSGWISRTLNSKISIPVSRFLVRTPATPNFLSVVIGCIGIFAGFLYGFGHPALGALFLELSTVLDRCDGEVARIKLLETKRGQWIDTIFDQLSFLSFVIGVPIGFYRLTQNPLALAFGGLNLAIFIFFIAWSFYFLTRYTNSGSMTAYFSIDNIIPPSKRSLVHRVIIKIRPMIKREFFSLLFIPIAILGGYPWVLAISSTALILALIHQVDDIIKLKRLKTTGTL